MSLALTKRLLLLFVFALAVAVEVSFGQSPNHSRLNRFYKVTNGIHWTNHTHWNTTKPICNWFGVQCSNEQTIIGLILPSNGLVGRVAKELYEISSLQTLNLKDNSLTDAGFEGINKDSSNIEVIDVSQNGLTSVTGIENAPDSLREIHLADNRLSSFPKELTSLHKLRNLYISKNKIQGTLPTTIGRMTSLKHLNAYGNGLSGQLPSQIGLLSNLQLFSLAENALTGTIPTTVHQMKSLVSFSLHNHVDRKGEFTGTLPTFHNLSNLQEVYLEGNALVWFHSAPVFGKCHYDQLHAHWLVAQSTDGYHSSRTATLFVHAAQCRGQFHHAHSPAILYSWQMDGGDCRNNMDAMPFYVPMEHSIKRVDRKMSKMRVNHVRKQVMMVPPTWVQRRARNMRAL